MKKLTSVYFMFVGATRKIFEKKKKKQDKKIFFNDPFERAWFNQK